MFNVFPLPILDILLHNEESEVHKFTSPVPIFQNIRYKCFHMSFPKMSFYSNTCMAHLEQNSTEEINES